jgi:CheY-like chemotaxis protein
MRKTPLILLADDNPDDQSFIRDAFSYVNANVALDTVDDGLELLQHLKSTPQNELPSLIVLDYNMPKMNGTEVLQALLKEPRYSLIPKIILSTSFYQSHINNCMEIGADGYLIKPDNVFAWKKIALNMLAYIKEPTASEKQEEVNNVS